MPTSLNGFLLAAVVVRAQDSAADAKAFAQPLEAAASERRHNIDVIRFPVSDVRTLPVLRKAAGH